MMPAPGLLSGAGCHALALEEGAAELESPGDALRVDVLEHLGPDSLGALGVEEGEAGDGAFGCAIYSPSLGQPLVLAGPHELGCALDIHRSVG